MLRRTRAYLRLERYVSRTASGRADTLSGAELLGTIALLCLPGMHDTERGSSLLASIIK